MIRVKIIEEFKVFDLQREVNDWLKENSNFELIDIKYSGTGCYSAYGVNHYSAMIIYKA